jgi:putative transposase
MEILLSAMVETHRGNRRSAKDAFLRLAGLTFSPLPWIAANMLIGALAQCFVEHLLKWQREMKFALLAFVVMPDHIHLLGILTGQRQLSEVVRILKGRTGRTLNSLLGQSGSFWQSAFYDHAVRREENLEAITRYIQENPVRQGLVVDPSEYPYSSANTVYAEQMLGWQWLVKGDAIW